MASCLLYLGVRWCTALLNLGILLAVGNGRNNALLLGGCIMHQKMRLAVNKHGIASLAGKGSCNSGASL